MNDVGICNLALGRIGEGGQRPIASLTESSESARACNRVFAITMASMVRMYAWPWARKAAALAVIVQDVPGWEYVYTYPTDCAFLLALSDSETDPGRSPEIRHPFKLFASTSGLLRVIATDLQDAWAHYTVDVTDPDVTDDLFQDALAWRIAAEVAIGLKANPGMAQNAMEQYQITLSAAVSSFGNEAGKDADPDPEDVRAYGAYSPWHEIRRPT